MSRSVGPRPLSVTPRTLRAVAEQLGCDLPEGADPTTPVTGVTHDSKQVRPGDVYLAVPGSRSHGADFAADAVGCGAVSVVTDPVGAPRARASGAPVLLVPEPRAVMGSLAAWVYGDPTAGLLLIGITGTNGKTTCSYLVESGLRAAGRTTGLVGTTGTLVAGQRVPTARTTPEATDLQALFAVMRENAVDAAVIEVSSHALVLGRVDGTVVDVAVFTNLGRDHLDFHSDLEDYFAAKAQLFTPERSRQGVVNVDDDHGRRIAITAGVPVTTFGVRSPDADWRASDVVLGPEGATFTLSGPDGARVECGVALPGAFNVENAVAAVVALVTAGVPLETAARGVAACPGVPGRLERVVAGQPWLAVVDFAHTPEAVADALAALREITAGRLVAVLGCGGDRDRSKRPLMGAAAARVADLVVVTSDNPRSEDPAEIVAAVAVGVRDAVTAGASSDLLVEVDRAAAISLAVAGREPGDTVAVLGKGHETGQEIAGLVHPFDDRLALRAAIEALGERA